ncbi:MAG: sugar ABC transporter substrate-binding protein [Chloroflexi bacterium]|nr:sugar ABC transporter substrate-binding protein [Chloroflexota bacterium]
MLIKKCFLVLCLVILGVTLVACAPAAAPKAEEAAPAEEAEAMEPVEIRYALWAGSQQPAYEQCAAEFTKANPNITVVFEQAGWGEYWDGITTGLVSGTAPDVFTNHLNYYPQLMSKGQLLDIQPYVEKDGVDLGIYLIDPELWFKDGARYGLPQDWDTIAVFYNKDMVEAAGITQEEMDSWTWNPDDGGTFMEIVAKLTLDANGNNGLEADFDKDNVVQWGFAGGPGDAASGAQPDWSGFAASLGYQHTDGPWSTKYYYDDPRVAATVQWWADLHLVHGYAPGTDSLSDGVESLFLANGMAMFPMGSWAAGWMSKDATFDIGFASLPAGPEGVKSPINGLSPAIYAGTEHPDEAWQWVKYLTSPDCANVVGDHAVVFPAIQSGVDNAIAAFSANGLDVSGFSDVAATPGATYLLPMTEHGTEIRDILQPVLQDIFDGNVTATEALPPINAEINSLFGEAAPAEEAEAMEPVEIRYALWAGSQQPAYEQCAAEFTKANPNITVVFEQAGWGEYWDGITTGLVSGTAPDVFTNHLNYYPQLMSKGQLLDIQPYVEKDGVDLGIYLIDPELWFKDGARYGLPQDWDTIAVFYNKDMVEAAGITQEEMDSWTWNPDDGGTFMEIVAKLTLDANGNNGLEADFDKDNVVQWGFAGGPGDAASGAQPDWSGFAASLGYQHTDGPWSTKYYYDDPRVAATVQWWADLHLVHGYAPGTDSLSDGVESLFLANGMAMFPMGSWAAGWMSKDATFDIGFASLPAGPEGVKSPINGLSPAIYAGTEHPDEAWQWVKYLTSPDCANVVGDHAVVFPAIQSGVDNAIAAFSANGLDVSGFSDVAATPGATYLLPMTEHGTEIRDILQPVLQDIFDGNVTAAEALPEINAEINALFE